MAHIKCGLKLEQTGKAGSTRKFVSRRSGWIRKLSLMINTARCKPHNCPTLAELYARRRLAYLSKRRSAVDEWRQRSPASRCFVASHHLFLGFSAYEVNTLTIRASLPVSCPKPSMSNAESDTHYHFEQTGQSLTSNQVQRKSVVELGLTHIVVHQSCQGRSLANMM